MKKFFVLLAIAFIMSPAFVHAASHEQLIPLLIDLKGWDAEKGQSMSMNMMGRDMINATREYNKDGKTVTALIMKGNPAMAMGGAQGMQTMSAETEDARINSKTINGFKVQTVYDKNDGSGVVSVFLTSGQSAGSVFSLNYSGITEKKALSLVKKFDWEKMKSVVSKIK